MDKFSRTEILIGKEGLKKLRNSKVAIFGIGGVGSFVAEGLARSGIGSLVLFDYDYIDVSNINRQIHSVISTVGRPKTEVMSERIKDINPDIKVDAHQVLLSETNSDRLVQPKWDYIVDAIDTVTAKISLITTAKTKGIPIISSMGAGNKLNPTKFMVSDIYSTSICPLSRIVRRELRKREIKSLKVVYSTEEPIRIAGEPHGRNIIGSVSFVPPVAGLIIAGEVVKDLISYEKG